MQAQTSTRPSPVKYDPVKKMMAAQYQGKEDIRLVESPRPIVTDPTDVIVKVTATTVCGSDLHIYHGLIPGMKKGDIIGHESVGVVQEVGPEVKKFKVGDRVVISAVIACGKCEYCKRNEWSCCDTTNTSQLQEQAYGHSTGALFGYTRSFGGYDGCQAEYVRVPFAEVNLFPIPEGLSDREAVLVADIACTGFHGTVLADVKQGDRVVVFGCGPVGLMTQMWSRYKGADIVVAIDVDQERLNFAKNKFGSIPINSKQVDPLAEVEKIIPGGPDKVIDCVGFRFPDDFLHKVEMKLKIETDAPNIVNLAIKMVRKNGRITLIGDYAGYTNHFNIGALMEKHLTLNGGQLWPHNYQKEIFDAMLKKKVNAADVLTHTFPLSKIDEVYRMFDKHENGMLKVFVVPDSLYKEIKS